MECQVFAEDDKHKIHAESIRILAEVGTKFHSPRALKIKKGK